MTVRELLSTGQRHKNHRYKKKQKNRKKIHQIYLLKKIETL